MKLTPWEIIKVFVGPTAVVLLAALTSHSATNEKISKIETRLESVDKNGSAAYQLQRDKYFQQQMDMLNRLSAIEQGQKDLKEDMTEIKRRLINSSRP